MKFKCDVERAGENVLMRLSGRLDEKAELPVWPKPVKGHLTVDMRELQLINSFGCRAWVMWTRGVRVEGGISLVNCSPAVVNQINILSSFLESRIEVRSIMVPYFCEDCGLEELEHVKLENADDRQRASRLPTEKPCAECRRTMELDIVKSHYFSFLNKRSA